MPLTEERFDPDPDSFETVPFYNYTSEDFVSEQGAMWNSKSYLIKAGEIKFYPVFLANHFAKHLINREIMRENESALNDDKLRQKIKAKILISNDEANKLLGLPPKKRIVKVATRKQRKEVISEKETKVAPVSKNKESEDIPEVEHSKEYKGVDIKSLR